MSWNKKTSIVVGVVCLCLGLIGFFGWLTYRVVAVPYGESDAAIIARLQKENKELQARAAASNNKQVGSAATNSAEKKIQMVTFPLHHAVAGVRKCWSPAVSPAGLYGKDAAGDYLDDSRPDDPNLINYVGSKKVQMYCGVAAADRNKVTVWAVVDDDFDHPVTLPTPQIGNAKTSIRLGIKGGAATATGTIRWIPVD